MSLLFQIRLVFRSHCPLHKFSYLLTYYVDQQTLKPDDDYVLPHQCLRTLRFLLQPLVCGTVFRHTSLLPLSRHASSAVVLNRIYLFSLSYHAF